MIFIVSLFFGLGIGWVKITADRLGRLAHNILAPGPNTVTNEFTKFVLSPLFPPVHHSTLFVMTVFGAISSRMRNTIFSKEELITRSK
jgi:hypothetical protein